MPTLQEALANCLTPEEHAAVKLPESKTAERKRRTPRKIKMTHSEIKMTLREEEAFLRARLKEIEDMTRISAQIKNGAVTITGLSDAPILTTHEAVRAFVKGGGLAQLRAVSESGPCRFRESI